MRTRRGSQALEFALCLPVLLILVSGVVDLGRQLTYADQLAAAVSEGALAGALADPNLGQDPVARAEDVASFAWETMEMSSPLVVDAALEGVAPDQQLRVVGSTEHGVLFGFVKLPGTTSYTSVVRVDHQ